MNRLLLPLLSWIENGSIRQADWVIAVTGSTKSIFLQLEFLRVML